jgi:ribosomal protein S18 acetylase RimI-like enzyme
MACNDEDPSQVYGYICAGNIDGIFVLHYIYVKHSFRNLGVGKSLLNAFEHDVSNAAIYTHHTRIAERLAAKYNFLYHPYVLFDLKDSDEQSKN